VVSPPDVEIASGEIEPTNGIAVVNAPETDAMANGEILPSNTAPPAVGVSPPIDTLRENRTGVRYEGTG